MSKESIRTTLPFTLEVITPVSIGSGQGLKVLDYILDTANHDVYILNQKKWFQYLYSINKLSEYELFIKKYATGNTKDTIFEWMERNIGILDESILKSISTRHVRCVKSAISKRTLNDIKLCMSLSDGSPYIPGSSLKGVIIASVIAYIIEQKQSFRNEWSRRFLHTMNDTRELQKCIRDYGNALDKLISSYIADITGTIEKDSTKKLFHGISVSDVMPVSKLNTFILPRYDSVVGKYERKSLPLYRECIVPNTKLKGTLSADIRELQKVGVQSMSELIQIIERHTQRIVSRWKQVFTGDVERTCLADLENTTCLLGSSIGFLHKTLLLPLFDDQRDEVDVIKSVLNLQRAFKKHNHWKDRSISPRTLKLTKYRGKDYIFGGVKLHFEND